MCKSVNKWIKLNLTFKMTYGSIEISELRRKFFQKYEKDRHTIPGTLLLNFIKNF